ncbi:MAG: FecR domain-containing protein [Geobacter sp.]|nr:FecR domain-containing protein [Geobacter sp.]
MQKLLAILSLCCLLSPVGVSADSWNEDLVVKGVSGDVTIGVFGGTEWGPLQEGTRLKQVDSIQVGKGEAELVLFKNTLLRLGTGSSMTVIELNAEITGFYLSKGAAKVEYVTATPNRLVFETAAGLAEPKGKAVFTVEATDDGAMEVSVQRGTVAAEGDKCRREVKKGSAVRIDQESCTSKALGK